MISLHSSLASLARRGLLGLLIAAWTVLGGIPDRRAYFLTPINQAIPATDSAAAASAIATGYKTDAGNLAWQPGDPPNGALPSITEHLRSEYDFAIGIASTMPYSHATPAVFASHNISRYNYAAIANEITGLTRPQVVIGAGHPGYVGTYGYVGGPATWQSLMSGTTSYTQIVTRTSGINANAALLAAAASVNLNAGQRLLGVFGEPSLNFGYRPALDAPGAPAFTPANPENPTLAGVVTATLGVLAQDPDGFFALFEQGDIDLANHENNFRNMLGSVWDLDQAVRTAEAFVSRPGGPEWSDTLLIVTADHANSYLRLFHLLGPGDLPRQEWLDRDQDGAFDNGEWSYPDGEISYQTTTHTNEPVTLQARGQAAGLFAQYAGSWYPGTRLVDNTQIFAIMRQAVAQQGVKHVILFIGDGMHQAHEVAASRYLYGVSFGLAWHAWGHLPDGWSGYAATWDVTTYNLFAGQAGPPAYAPPQAPADLGINQARLGYDPARGGIAPEYRGGLLPVYFPLIQR